MTREQLKRLGEIIAQINKLREDVDELTEQTGHTMNEQGTLTDASDQLALVSSYLSELTRN